MEEHCSFFYLFTNKESGKYFLYFKKCSKSWHFELGNNLSSEGQNLLSVLPFLLKNAMHSQTGKKKKKKKKTELPC